MENDDTYISFSTLMKNDDTYFFLNRLKEPGR